ncbi:helix-turn-helix transcriptional regulator [Brochothrix thermosphacta]|uniref:helix-turn-helix domain-containing protein n=1 Tax=Brochothrix thermosphacta TaxID=2756 RepID=UPI002712DDB7|nr:helix-turn-helix transcriptional regulator [Brochothrix thermosphacta]MDO7864862.1 helix-turn-helix transcriptional regulator [Brochothrix thermosphacta]
MDIFLKVKQLCKENKIAVSELERIMGFGSSSIRKWEGRSPSAERVKKVAEFFNVTTDYLLDHSPTIHYNSADGDELARYFNSKTQDLPVEYRKMILEETKDFIDFRLFQSSGEKF